MSTKPNHILIGPAAAALTAGLIVSLVPYDVAARPSIVISRDLRAEPRADAEVVDHLAPGASVSFLIRRGAWLGIRHGDGISWALTDQPQPDEASDDDTCRATNKMVPHLHDRARVAAAARLRNREGHDSDGDPKLSRGAKVWVHASDRGGSWVLVEDAAGELGWVRRCEVDGIASKPGDQVLVARGGNMLSRARDGRSISPLAKGDRVTIAASTKDWVQITNDDGMRGWYPAEKLAHDTLDDTAATSLWQPGVLVAWPCDDPTPPRHTKYGSVRCGDRVRIIRTRGGAKHPMLLVVDDDGRWGWIDERVTPIEIGDAVVEGARRVDGEDQRAVAAVTRKPTSLDSLHEISIDGDASLAAANGHDTRRVSPVNHDAMTGMKMDGRFRLAGAEQNTAHPIATPIDANAAADHGAMNGMTMDQDASTSTAERNPAITSEPNREIRHEAMMGMGMGDMSMPTDGAAMSMSIQTAFPVGDGAMTMGDGTGNTMMRRTPRYEVSVTTSGSARLGSGFDVVLAATFSAAGSMTADGQSRQEKYQGGQASLSVSRHLGEHLTMALGGGYALAFASPGDAASSDWMFLAIQPGPFARVSLGGDFGESWSYSLRGTAQLSKDADGMPASILMTDAMMMVSLNRWLTAGLNGMAMKMAMGDTMVSAGPSLSVGFLKKLSGTVAATAMNSAGMTMWTISTGMGVHF